MDASGNFGGGSNSLAIESSIELPSQLGKKPFVYSSLAQRLPGPGRYLGARYSKPGIAVASVERGCEDRPLDLLDEISHRASRPKFPIPTRSRTAASGWSRMFVPTCKRQSWLRVMSFDVYVVSMARCNSRAPQCFAARDRNWSDCDRFSPMDETYRRQKERTSGWTFQSGHRAIASKRSGRYPAISGRENIH